MNRISIFARRLGLGHAGRAMVFTACLGTAFAGDLRTPVLAPDLRLKSYLKLVLAHNENLQAGMLATESERHKFAAELGIFEPALVGSVGRISNSEPIDKLSRDYGFRDRNDVYDAGLESLVPTGGRIRLGYAISSLGNSPAASPFGARAVSSDHWQTFTGATIVQPLLKGGGVDATYSKIRLAAIASDIGFQAYRRQLMLTVSQAEAAYWGLYFAQEQLQFVSESVQVAETVLNDSKARLKAGKGAEMDILEAESGAALRRTKKNEALQRYYDATSQVAILCGAAPVQGALKAVDYPECAEIPFSFAASCQESFELNPDYLISKKRVAEETIRLGVARNQRLPELNARAAYGYSGMVDSSHPEWSVGLELNVPLFGGVTGRNSHNAAKLTQNQAQLSLQGIGTQLSNSVSNSIKKNRTILGTVHDYETVVRFRQDLVKTELARLEAGKVDAHRVLEVEADLFEARQSLAEAQVQFQRSLLELQLAEGSILTKRKLEISRQELREKTAAMIKNGQLAINRDEPVSNKERK